MIIEESENVEGRRIATVSTSRGDVSVNVDKLVETFAQSMSDYNNELRGGWELNGPWFKGEFEKLLRAANPAS